MNSKSIHLAKTLNEISDFAKSAREKANGRFVLVPVDFSDHSGVALTFAASIAGPLDADLVVLHVIHDPAEMPGYYSSLIESSDFERIDDIAEQAFREFMSKVVNAQSDCSALQAAALIMIVGLPITRILEAAGELEPLMVVMGSHGRTGLDNLIIGSKATQVVQRCRYPVTIVKKTENAD